MAKLYGKLPSEIIGVEDDYTAFCFNEACTCILMHLQDGDKPHYVSEDEVEIKKEYKNFSDFYKDVLNK